MDSNVTGEKQQNEPSPCGLLITLCVYMLALITFPISAFFIITVVKEYQRAVIFRLGRIQGGMKGPGLFFTLPWIDDVVIIDLRAVTLDIPPQEILTRDSVTVAVDAVVYYHIADPIISVLNIENSQYATKLLAATTLRNILGTRSLQEILQERETVAKSMRENLDRATVDWGCQVERVEIKDVRLPVQMQRAMATEAEAAREARAKLVAAEGEEKASQALKEAADVLGGSPTAIQLRYLQSLSDIAAENNSTIIFPIPVDMLSQLSPSIKED